MAIATLPTTQSEVRIVFTEDPDVRKKNDDDCGWIPVSDADVAKGADVLEVAPLNTDQRVAGIDAAGPYSRGLARARSGMRAVNGKRDRTSMEAWLARCPENVIFLLGIFIDSITDGTDPQEAQRALFRDVPGLSRPPAPEDGEGA